MKTGEPKAIYTPSDEPYLGRESVLQFDKTIVSCLEKNTIIARHTHETELSDLQRAACQIVPQGINLALAIRELVRQGYLFAAVVLMRPLIERAATISYLVTQPEEVAAWNRGWLFRQRPSLSKMLETMGGADVESAKQICELFGHIVHGDPVGSDWNLVELRGGGLGYSVSKVVDDPALCDFICFQSYCYLIVLTSMASVCFPEVG